MLSDVRGHRGLDRLGRRSHRNKLLNLGILGCGHMRLNMGLMVLPLESLHRLLVQDVHVLPDRIPRFDFILQRDDLVRIPDPHHLKHLPVEEGEVV